MTISELQYDSEAAERGDDSSFARLPSRWSPVISHAVSDRRALSLWPTFSSEEKKRPQMRGRQQQQRYSGARRGARGFGRLPPASC
eukprot:CAMPEP_0115843152 /NCGR_PEP_ID=MMETSP0287-20121206/8167_1 /TAXON_ID=412157 /ORGANISM="Chrysochromulina rotalis, Strain UIO044" /LENGTH=85 /DNA_ID=CAMNT_0003296841 /DNA_START=19 /DNA_END=276 /DNA_ORIENTATION=-